MQLIAFSDASKKGYGCVICLRVGCPGEATEIHLLRQKSKVAPFKVQSMHRLELNAALLASRLLPPCIGKLKSYLQIEGVFYFLDFRNVLYWLQTPPHELKIYVANRVVQILEVAKPSFWQYIHKKLNPADYL